MDEKLQDELELTAEEPIEEPQDLVSVEDEEMDLEVPEMEQEPEDQDEIFFTSDFVMDAEEFNETAEFAYLQVANNALMLSALIIVFMLSSLLSGKTDYLMFVPIVALVVCISQIRRYASVDKEITNAHATIVYRADGEQLHYHLEFGEYIHTTNNGKHAPKRDLNEITKICETARYWLLCLDHQLYIAVRKDSITGENPSEFIPYLQHCCKDLKQKKIIQVTGKKKHAVYGVIACVAVTVISLLVGFFLGYIA